MAKLSYVISKNSNCNGKHNFHFDCGGSGKFFQIITKWIDGKKEDAPAGDHSEITDLLSKLVVDGDYTIARNSETRIEFEGSTDEIKEFAVWSVNQVKAEAGSLKAIAEFVKEYCKALVDMFKGIFGYAEHVEEVQAERDEFEAENKKLTKEMEDLRESLKKSSAKKGNTSDSKNQ